MTDAHKRAGVADPSTRSAERRQSLVLEVVLADDSATRAKFLEHFEAEARQFAANMDAALRRWGAIDALSRQGREPVEDYACVAAVTFTSINLLIQSVQCFLGGQAMASGNLARQSIESIAVAILSADKHLSVRRDFIANRYSSNGALRQLKSRARRLDVNGDAVEKLIQAKRFYDLLSHPTALTLAHGVEFDASVSFLGAAFDPGKLEGYAREIESIVALSSIFPAFIAGVRAQLESWSAEAAGGGVSDRSGR